MTKEERVRPENLIPFKSPETHEVKPGLEVTRATHVLAKSASEASGGFQRAHLAALQAQSKADEIKGRVLADGWRKYREEWEDTPAALPAFQSQLLSDCEAYQSARKNVDSANEKLIAARERMMYWKVLLAGLGLAVDIG